MRRRMRRLVAGALAAVATMALPVGVSFADSLTPETTWRLRGQVRSPASGLGEPRPLPEAADLLREAACRTGGDLLGDGEPRRTEVQLTLWRQAGPTDQTHTGVSGVRCEARMARKSAFRLQAQVVHPREPGNYVHSGRMSLDRAVELSAKLANGYAPRALETGEQVWITVKIQNRRKSIRAMIRGLARRHRVDAGTALRVAECESGFNPRAYSAAGPYGGVYQQAVRLWPRRARHYGHPGASVFDPYANVDVSLKMAAHGGWGHWGCA